MKHYALRLAAAALCLCMPLAYAEAYLVYPPHLSGDLIAPRRGVRLTTKPVVFANWKLEAIDASIDVPDIAVVVDSGLPLPSIDWTLRNAKTGQTFDGTPVKWTTTTSIVLFHDVLIEEGFATFNIRGAKPIGAEKVLKSKIRFTLCAPQSAIQNVCTDALRIVYAQHNEELALHPQNLETGEDVDYSTVAPTTRWVWVR